MRFVYADPPYLGMCHWYGHDHREPYGCWDDLATHELIARRVNGQVVPVSAYEAD